MRNNNFSGTNLSSVDVQPYAMPPYVYRDCEMLSVVIRSTPEVMRDLVPELLVPNSDNYLVLYVGLFNVTKPAKISYSEAGIMIPVTFGDREGTYMPVLYLDESEMLTGGREVWGFPKFFADVEYTREENSVTATVNSEGTTLISAHMQLDKRGEAPPMHDHEHFLLKSIPSPTGVGFDVRQINTCLVRDDNRRDLFEGPVELTLDSTKSNPLGNIQIEEIVVGYCNKGDLILDVGEVIHDFLTDEQE
jgi:acetoacetate decarboxylase